MFTYSKRSPSNDTSAPTTSTLALLALGLLTTSLIGCNSKPPEQAKTVTRDSLIEAIQGANRSKASNDSAIELSTSRENGPVASSQRTQSDLPPTDSASDPLDAIKPPEDSPLDALAGFLDENQLPDNSKPILGSDTKLADPVKMIRPVEDDPSADWTIKTTIPKKNFELNFIADKPVGVTVREIQFRPGSEEDVVRTEMRTVTRVSTQGELKTQIMDLVTQETKNGNLIRIEGSLTVGDTKNEFTGVVDGAKLEINSISNGNRSKTNIPWSDDYRGPFAIEQSLIRNPLKEDELRIIRHLDPMVGRLIETSLLSIEVSKSSTMLSGSVELREISVKQRDGNQIIQSSIWADSNGEILKSLHPSLKLRSFRVEEQATLEFQRLMDLANIQMLKLPLEVRSDEAKQILASAGRRESVTFLINSKSADPFESVSRNSLQAIKSINARTAEVTAYRTAEDAKNAKILRQENSAPPDALRINDWIDPKSAPWQKFLKNLWGDRNLEGLSNHDKAILVRDALRARWKTTPTTRKIGNLSNLIVSCKGSSWEQALVLGNALRTFKIPTRIAIGYVVKEEAGEPVLVLEPWLEIFDESQWFSIDPADGGLDAIPNRIKVTESYFQDTYFFEELASVSRWAEDVTVEVLAQ